MPDLTWNKAVWADSYHWADGGEEWSTTWRGSEAQWLGSILSSAASFLAGAADSGNRAWIRTLDKISAARMRDEYVGVDLSEKCTEACQKILSDARHARFVTNDSQSLEAVEDHTIGLVFSFDSLVHAEYPILGRFV